MNERKDQVMTPEREKLIRRTWSAYQTGYDERRALARLMTDPEIRSSRQVTLPFTLKLTEWRHDDGTILDPHAMSATYHFEREAVAFDLHGLAEAYRHRVVCEGLILEESLTPLKDDAQTRSRMKAALRKAP